MASSIEVLTWIELSLRAKDMHNALIAASLSSEEMSKEFKTNLDSMIRRMDNIKDSLAKLEDIVS